MRTLTKLVKFYYMRIRTTNGQRLKKWLNENGDQSKKDLHLKSGCSVTWIEKVTAGRYKSSPRPMTRRALCQATGIAEDELFPLVGANEDRSAS